VITSPSPKRTVRDFDIGSFGLLTIVFKALPGGGRHLIACAVMA
jgi:hypothetical protein